MSDVAQSHHAKPMTPWSWVLVAFAIVWCWLAAWASTPGRRSLVDAYIIGGAVGAAFFPFLIAYVVRGRKKKRDWNSFARWFFWLALIIPALQFSGLSGRIAADRRAERDLGRQFTQELTAFQSRYASDQRCEFDPPLYSAASFVDRQSIKRSMTQLSDCIALYQEMKAEIDRMVQRLEALARSSFSSAEYRADVLRRFREGFQRGTSQRRLAATSRTRWREETEALYDFASRSVDQIWVVDDEIVIRNEQVLAQFNTMLNAASEAQATLIRVETQVQAANKAKIEELNEMLK
ncbi:MAG: hypothetical protein ACRD5G_01860 [Candidatus Acidiferrales bacterium]